MFQRALSKWRPLDDLGLILEFGIREKVARKLKYRYYCGTAPPFLSILCNNFLNSFNCFTLLSLLSYEIIV